MSIYAIALIVIGLIGYGLYRLFTWYADKQPIYEVSE